MKRILSILISIVFILSSINIMAFASDYEGHWAESSIKLLIDSDVIDGDSYGYIKPDNNISRAEFVKVINRYYGYQNKAANNFADVSPAKWYSDEFLIAKAEGYITGDEKGYANPDAYITRAEVCVILKRVLNISGNADDINFSDKHLIPDWAAESIGAMYDAGLINGYKDGQFKPKNNITRAEAFAIISRTEINKEDEKEETENKNTTDIVPNISAVINTPSRGGSGGGGGGGGSSSGGARPSVEPTSATFTFVSYDPVSGNLTFEARYASTFDMKIDVISAYSGELSPAPQSSFDFVNIPYVTRETDVYVLNLKTYLNSIVNARKANNETYAYSLNVNAEAGKNSTGYIKFSEGVYSMDIETPENLNSVFAEQGNTDMFKLSWSAVSDAEGYRLNIYDGEINDIVETKDITSVEDTIDVSLYGVDKTKLYFTVQSKVNGIYSAESDEKTILLSKPEFVSVKYIPEENLYRIEVSHAEENILYTYRLGTDIIISDSYLDTVDITIPAGSINESNMPTGFEVKAVSIGNESPYALYEYDFTYAGGNGTKDTPYYIADYYQFRNIYTNPSAYYVQTANITLPLSYQPNQTVFTGEYDGNNKTVNYADNFTVSVNNFGLFYSLDGAHIKNLTVDGNINAGACQYVAGLAYTTANDSKFTNCVNSVDILSSKGYIAGLVANNTPASFVACVNEGHITGGDSVVAGFVTRGVDSNFTSCVNKGNITGTDNVGGFQGFGGGIYISCINEGDVYATKASGAVAGGFIGALSSASEFSKCANLGDIEASRSTGGIVAAMAGNKNLIITGSYNTGTITVFGSSNVEGGGLVGRGYYAGSGTNNRSTTITITDCYNAGIVNASVAGSAIGVPDQSRPSNAPTVYTHKIKNFYDATNTSMDIFGAGPENSDTAITSIIIENAFVLDDGMAYGVYKTADELKVLPDGFNTGIWIISTDVNYPYIQLADNLYYTKN